MASWASIEESVKTSRISILGMERSCWALRLVFDQLINYFLIHKNSVENEFILSIRDRSENQN